MAAKKSKIVIAIMVIVGVFAWLTLSSFNENMQYFITVQDLQAMDKADLNENLRIKGFLVAGSIEETSNSLEVYFMLEDKGATMKVRFDQERPDTFKDGSEVLVEGKFHEDGYFDAKTLMAKCPSKYESEEGYNLEDYDPSKNNTEKENAY